MEKRASDSGQQAELNTERREHIDELKDKLGERAVRPIVEASYEKEEDSYTKRDLEAIAEATGRAVDDPEVIKLNLALKYDNFQKYKKLYENNKATNTFIQEGTQQDIATAKAELEEAMYL